MRHTNVAENTAHRLPKYPFRDKFAKSSITHAHASFPIVFKFDTLVHYGSAEVANL